MSQQIIFDYTDDLQSAPINADWALELGLFDCETHNVNERMYPLGCADDAAETTPTDINPLLRTEPAGSVSPTLLIVVALLALGAGAVHIFSKGKPDANPAK